VNCITVPRIPAALIGLSLGTALVALSSGPALAAAALPPAPAAPGPVVPPPASQGTITGPRAASPVVLTGAQIPGWSGPAAQGLAAAYPSGVSNGTGGAPNSGVPVPNADGVRSAHNGTLVVPPKALQTGVDPARVAAYRWTGTGFSQVAVQVDQRFPYFLANGRSTFSVYSGTDEELTYSYAPDAHDTGEEAWKKVAGDCSARYPTAAEAATSPLVTPGAGETRADYTSAMTDPVPTLDDDDEVSFRAGDAGAMAPLTQAPPAGTDPGSGRTVAVTDPKGGPTGYVYLFTQPGGSSFTAATGQVHATRPAGADTWMDRNSFPKGSTEQVGTSNTNYGPNLTGTVCDAGPGLTTPSTTSARDSTDRFPRDSWDVSTDVYHLKASGRWLVRGYSVAKPGRPGVHGPSLVARFKGRAFQQSPNSSVSLVGFEDEQVNWEANAAELGWRSGPVRAIREVWGADSGTNVTKTEIYYRDADVSRFHVRVHPIPPDGLYTSWSYDPTVAACYYDVVKTGCVPVDGVNDEAAGNVDKLPVTGQPAFSDSPDPTFSPASAVDTPEEVAGRDDTGGLVYTFEFTSATTAANATAVPYYRDDACLDDGTGDQAIHRPLPGEDGTSQQVRDAYVAYWQAHTTSPTKPATYADLRCDDPTSTSRPDYQRRPFAAAFGQHGIHFYTTGDSDNAFGPKPLNEVVGQQTRYAVPMGEPTNVSTAYGANVVTPLQPLAFPYGAAGPTTPPSAMPEAPLAILLPVGGLGLLLLSRRRRRRAA